MTEPSLSVIVHGGRTQAALSATLTSILNQTLSPIEIVALLDAGSSSDAADLIASYAPHVRFVRTQRRRPGSLNAVVRDTTARYVAFVAAGKEWLPEYGNVQVRFLDNQQTVSVSAARPPAPAMRLEPTIPRIAT